MQNLGGRPTILGLDLGVASIGWALIAAEANPDTGRLEPRSILKTGVRVFDAGMDNMETGGRGDPRGAQRREARLRRRQTERRSRRKRVVFHRLQRAGLLPPGEPRAVWESTLFRAPENDVYALRARALEEGLPPYQLGRALYHLAQRRGFLSNRKAAPKKKDEEGVVLEGIGALRAEMDAAGARTLGEYLAGLDPEKQARRKRYTSRDMYEAEFERIWAVQVEHHPDLLTEDLRTRLHRAIFYQRPLKSQKHLIGACELEPGRKRAPLGLLIAQRFRLLQKVNDLTVHPPDGPERTLTDGERTALLDALEHKGDRTFKQARKLLKLPDDSSFNLEAGDETRLVGNRTGAKLAKVFGKRWWDLSAADRDQVVEDLRSIQIDTTLLHRAERVWGLDADAAQQLAAVVLEDGYLSLSRQALAKLVPLMEDGMPYATARKQVYGDDLKAGEPCDVLPPVLDAVPELRNPVVTRTLTELRRVVNDLVKRYGTPTLIRVELARDLKKNSRQRDEVTKRNRRNQRERDAARKRIIEEVGIPDPRPDDILKLRLAEECNWTCPYTGVGISMHSLFTDSAFEIEHIVPFSRCLDDSYLNKTLCAVAENRRKRNRTPWEAYGPDADRWETIMARVRGFSGDARREKARRFQVREVNIAEFESRQLNDTRYASRLATKYLGLLYGGQVDAGGTRRIQAGRGGITAFLRSEWGLNAILNVDGTKSRDDHRHHAVDALCVALTGPGTVQVLATAAGRADAEGRRRFGRVHAPWPMLLDDARRSIGAITVSHRVDRRVNGALHEETHYSPEKAGPDGKAVRHVRKALAALSVRDVDTIVDPAVRETVRAKLDELDQPDPKKAFAAAENLPMLTARRTGRETFIQRVRIRRTLKAFSIGRGPRERHVVTDTNHHVVIVETTDAKGRPKWDGHVVSRFTALQRKRAREPVVQRACGPDARFICSLAPGEMIRLESDDLSGLFVVRSISQRQAGHVNLEFVRINDARLKAEIRAAGDWWQRSIGRLRLLDCQKVVVSPLGEVQRAND